MLVGCRVLPRLAISETAQLLGQSLPLLIHCLLAQAPPCPYPAALSSECGVGEEEALAPDFGQGVGGAMRASVLAAMLLLDMASGSEHPTTLASPWPCVSHTTCNI